MDCIDCHNRPTHTFQLPDRALDQEIAEEASARSCRISGSKQLRC